LYYGALDKAELQKIKKHLSLLTVLPVTNRISDRFLELMGTYCLSHKLSLPDALIAATSLIHQMALRLSKLFGNSPEFWLNLQRAVDLWEAETAIEKEIQGIQILQVA
jgi:predicted nucleic acid-binding protein